MNHTQILSTLAAMLLVAGTTQAATPPSPRATAAAAASSAPVPAAVSHHFIWRASKGHARIYLVGSIHTLNPNDYPLPQAMESAFQDSAALVEEVNLTMLDPNTLQQEALKLGRYPSGESLQKNLPPASYKQLAAVADSLDLDMNQLDRLRPWLAGLTITSAQFRQASFKTSDGVDNHFADEAQMMEKPVIGLETPRYQLDLLAQLPEKAQLAMLANSAEEAANFATDVHKLISTWQAGDAAGLNKIMQQDFAHAPVAYQKLITDRDRAWFPRLEHYAESGRQYFVVVGAAHLVGADGLLAMFRKAGYKLEQL